MNGWQWLIFGLLSTLLMTVIVSGAQGLGVTRMGLPYLVGSMFTTSRSRAKLYGFFGHLAFGQLFLLFYVAMFHTLGTATIWIGALFGLLHAIAVLTIGVEIMPGLHPHMATERGGPTSRRRLEPPGFFALHYGPRTPVVVVLSHVVYGGMFGWLYSV